MFWSNAVNKFGSSGVKTTDIVLKALFDANNTILAANTSGSPVSVTVAEQRIVGRITSGNITALTAAQVLVMLGQEVQQTEEFDNGESGAGAFEIDWSNGRTQKITLTGGATFTFANPTAVGIYTLRLLWDSTGGYTITFPGTSILEWQGGAAPEWSNSANAQDLLMVRYHNAAGGMDYWGAGIIDFR